MEEHKLFNEIKSAAENAETKDFPGMESVWNRVEQKLDKKEDKIAIGRWKKIAVAASLLLVATLGYLFFKNNPDELKPNEAITLNDSIKEATPQSNDIVISEPQTQTKPNDTNLNPAIKPHAEAILQKQLNSAGQVALHEISKTEESVASGTYPTNEQEYFSAPVKAQTDNDSDDKIAMKAKRTDSKDVELFMNREIRKPSITKKEAPLVIVGDKVVKEKLEDIEFSASDSLMVLNDPIYIINGVEFNEQQVFGPNPTSPYTPLNKQEIESISILQNEKAIEIYGEKGRKGVVIITTRKKLPAANAGASKKAK